MNVARLGVAITTVLVIAASPGLAETKFILGGVNVDPVDPTDPLPAASAPASGNAAALVPLRSNAAALAVGLGVDPGADPGPPSADASNGGVGVGGVSPGQTEAEPESQNQEAARIAEPPTSAWRRMLSAIIRLAPAGSR